MLRFREAIRRNFEWNLCCSQYDEWMGGCLVGGYSVSLKVKHVLWDSFCRATVLDESSALFEYDDARNSVNLSDGSVSNKSNI